MYTISSEPYSPLFLVQATSKSSSLQYYFFTIWPPLQIKVCFFKNTILNFSKQLINLWKNEYAPKMMFYKWASLGRTSISRWIWREKEEIVARTRNFSGLPSYSRCINVYWPVRIRIWCHCILSAMFSHQLDLIDPPFRHSVTLTDNILK